MAESTQCMAQRLTLHDEICERVAGLAPAPVALRILEVLRNERAPVQRSGGCHHHGSATGGPVT